MKAVNVLLYEGFTTMDALGPAEVLSRAREGERKCYEIEYFSVFGGLVGSSTNAKIWTRKLSEIAKFDVLLVPGGFAVRELAHDSEFIAALGFIADMHGLDEAQRIARTMEYVWNSDKNADLF